MANSKKSKKERKFAKITIDIDGVTYKKSIAYYTLDDFAKKKEKAIEKIKRQAMKTFEQVADEWEEYHAKSIQVYTQMCYQAPVKDLKRAFGDKILKDITSMDFQKFLEKMALQGYAKQTIQLRKITMKQIFDYAILQGYVSNNPIPVCKTPKNTPVSKRTLPSDEDISRIKAHPNSMWGLYCNLLIYTGLRREEALALTYEDIDFDSEVIHITKALIFENGKSYIRDSLKSSAGRRTVPLLAPLKSILDKTKAGYIFTVKDNKPLVKYEFDSGINKFKAEIGLSCTSHQLRHYFATLCFDAELDEKDVQDIMGHSKISLTKEIYTHIREERRITTANKLNNFLEST